MHHDNFHFSLHQISKIEGHASLDVEISDNKVEKCHFAIADFKRFYTKAVEKKPAISAPQLLSRICGTCSNAHIIASLKAVEEALDIKPTPLTIARRELINAGMYIRDHALHLFIFVLPDIYQVDSILDFDEFDPKQKKLLEDLFSLKSAGNKLSILMGGRSVHAPDLMAGGFARPVNTQEIPQMIQTLKTVRPIALDLVKLFAEANFNFTRNDHYVALRGEDHFDYILSRKLKTQDGRDIPDTHYRGHLQHIAIPYSHASGYQFEGKDFMVGALARLNINADLLHQNTRSSLSQYIELFPSHNVHHNNLAQAIEIVDSIDYSIDLMEKTEFIQEAPIAPARDSGDGLGIIEAPRGTLYHAAHIKDKIIDRYEVIVPTGQNQINIENDLKVLIQSLIGKVDQPQIEHECEKLIRAYDPCMSCASHFLKVKWQVA